MTRYRGGTYSPTVDTIVFTDVNCARTDLIRPNANLRDGDKARTDMLEMTDEHC
jgi:hypothetical protein